MHDIPNVKPSKRVEGGGLGCAEMDWTWDWERVKNKQVLSPDSRIARNPGAQEQNQRQTQDYMRVLQILCLFYTFKRGDKKRGPHQDRVKCEMRKRQWF